MSHIKLFEDFLNESEMTIEDYAKQAEKILQIELIPTYDSREDGYEPEEEDDGHFINFEFGKDLRSSTAQTSSKFGLSDVHLPDLTVLRNSTEPPLIAIYENGTFQLWHDSNPYPVSSHSPQAARHMQTFMNPWPISLDRLKKEDVKNFLDGIIEEYGEEND
jgi:hypothetical protein